MAELIYNKYTGQWEYYTPGSGNHGNHSGGSPPPPPSSSGAPPPPPPSDATTQLHQEYDNSKPREAPSISATGVAPSQGVTAPYVGAGPTVSSTAPVVAGLATAGQVTAPAPVAAAGVAPVATAAAAPVTAATIATDPQAEMRARTRTLLDAMELQAAGLAPSAAEIALQRQTQKQLANSYALAADARGSNVVNALRGAMDNEAAVRQDAVGQMAELRAREQADAQGRLAGVLGQTRGQDIELAGQQAGFQQQANVVGAQLGTQASLQNATEANRHGALVAQLEQEAAQKNAERTLQAGTTNATLGTQTSVSNAGNVTQANTAAAANASHEAVAQAQVQADMQKLQAELGERAGEFTANAANVANLDQAKLDIQTKMANLDAVLKQRGLDDAARQQLLNSWLTAQGQALGHEAAMKGLEQAKTQADRDFWVKLVGAVVGGVAGAGAKAGAAASDRRTKRDIRALLDHLEGKDEIDDLLDKVKPYAFKYKEPHAEGARPGQRYGVMAQDLERSPVGASIVIEDRGVKKIDPGAAVGVLLAAMAKMHQRLKKGGR